MSLRRRSIGIFLPHELRIPRVFDNGRPALKTGRSRRVFLMAAGGGNAPKAVVAVTAAGGGNFELIVVVFLFQAVQSVVEHSKARSIKTTLAKFRQNPAIGRSRH